MNISMRTHINMIKNISRPHIYVIYRNSLYYYRAYITVSSKLRQLTKNDTNKKRGSWSQMEKFGTVAEKELCMEGVEEHFDIYTASVEKEAR